MNRMRYVIAYDVSDNKRRRLLARKLESVGYRVQESVFETYMSPGEIDRIIADCSPHILIEDNDSLRVYRICENCSGYFKKIGGPEVDWSRDIII
jgi:CRISPR-associated protein Cas2